MEELVSVLLEIRDELILVNEKLDSIQGNGLFDSLAAVCDKLDEIKGNGFLTVLPMCVTSWIVLIPACR